MASTDTGQRAGGVPVADLLSEIARSGESPALVNLLLHRGVPHNSALPATVLDLAARGHVKIEEVAPGEFLARLPHQHHADNHDRLAAHEQRVLGLLRQRASGGVVPVRALSLGADDEARFWWDEFAADVTAQARAQRLVPPFHLRVLSLYVAAAVCVVVAMVARSSGNDSPLAWVLIGIAVAVLLALTFAGDDAAIRATLSRQGRSARRRWHAVRSELHAAGPMDDLPPSAVAVWRRPLAYAAALELAPVACHGIPIGPDPQRAFWVRRGGMWRRLRARYPHRFPPAWGSTPLRAAAVAAVWSLAAAALLFAAVTQNRWDPHPPFSLDAARTIGDLEPVIVVSAAATLLVFGWRLLEALADLVSRPAPIRGVVVGRYVRQGSRWNPWNALVPRQWFLAIDTGDADFVPGWRVSEADFLAIGRDDEVVALVDRRLRHVREIQRASLA